MNKQEVIDEIEACKSPFISEDDTAFNHGLDKALSIIKQLNEPEKVVVSKLEAEWLDKLKAYYRHREDRLYVITRQGWGNDFCFSCHGEQIELSYKPYEGKEDIESVKRRLVNAILYGYEVEKEELYTARLKSTGEYLYYDKDYGNAYHMSVCDNIPQKVKGYHFTEEELIEYFAWENEAYEIEEVEE